MSRAVLPLVIRRASSYGTWRIDKRWEVIGPESTGGRVRCKSAPINRPPATWASFGHIAAIVAKQFGAAFLAICNAVVVQRRAGALFCFHCLPPFLCRRGRRRLSVEKHSKSALLPRLSARGGAVLLQGCETRRSPPKYQKFAFCVLTSLV